MKEGRNESKEKVDSFNKKAKLKEVRKGGENQLKEGRKK